MSAKLSATASIADIVRLWAAETHLIPPTTPGEVRSVVTPPLFDAPGQHAATRLAFDWAVPTNGAALAEVTEVRLIHPDERIDKVAESDAGELLARLLQVAAYRAGVEKRTEGDAQAAHVRLAASLAESSGPWLRTESFFFPTLNGADRQQGTREEGMLWVKTSAFGGPDEQAPVLSLADFDYPQRVSSCPDLEGFELRDADPARDAEIISAWMNTQLALSFRQAWPVDQWRQELELLTAQPHTRPLVLSFNETPVGYLELYRPAHMSIGASYPTDPRTVGVHMGMADKERTGRGVGRHLVTQFGYSIVEGDPELFSYGFGEPDLLNEAARGAARHTLGQEVAELAFPNKCAVLISSEAPISLIRSYRV